MTRPGSSLRFAIAMVAALARQPALVPIALRQAVTMAPSRWWAKPPYVPLPPRDYLEFRTVTATGDDSWPPTVADTMIWLDWCRSMRALPARRRQAIQ